MLGWGTWTATRWYGTPGGGGPGEARVRADAFRIGSDATVAETPIDGAASIIPPGAWPTGGDDHVISTAGAGATVVAKDPLNGYEFAGWLQLIWGGDSGGEFVESDAGSGGSIGGAGFYDHVVGGNFAAAQGVSADLLAAYGYHDDGGLRPFLKWWRDVFFDPSLKIPPKGDPSPEDLIRLKILQQMLEQTKPDTRGGLDFQNLIEMAPKMNHDELKRAIQSVETSLALGKTAIQAMEGQLKQFGG